MSKDVKIKSIVLNKQVSKEKAKEGFNAYFDVVYVDGKEKKEITKVGYLKADKSYDIPLPIGVVKAIKNGKEFSGEIKEKKPRKSSGDKTEKKVAKNTEKKVDKKKEKDAKKADKKVVEKKKPEKKVEKKAEKKQNFDKPKTESIFG